MRARRAVILAGGRGTRLRPYTVVLPKPLMPIGDFPILEVIVRQLARAGFGPTIGGPIAMGYVERRFADPGTPVVLIVRGRELPASVVALPFVPHRYHRGA